MTSNAPLIIAVTLFMLICTLVPTYIVSFRKKVTADGWSMA